MRLKIGHLGLMLVILICLFFCFAVSASADSTSAIWPQQTVVTNSGGSLLVDASGAPNGYFFAAVSYNTNHRLKLPLMKRFLKPLKIRKFRAIRNPKIPAVNANRENPANEKVASDENPVKAFG